MAGLSGSRIAGLEQMRPVANDFKVLSDLFPLWQKEGVSTALELFCGAGKFVRLLRDCGFTVHGTEPETDLAIESQRDGASVFPYSVSDFHKFDDGQFDLVGMVCIDRSLEDKIELIVESGLRICSKIFFYSFLVGSCGQRVLDTIDKLDVDIVVRKHNEVEGVSLIKI